MKIAVWHNLPSGGGKRALYYHVRGLVERGHKVEAWCPPTADRAYLPLTNIVREHVIPMNWKPRRTRSRVGRAWANYSNVVEKLNALDRHSRRCAHEMRAGGFDLLLANADRDFMSPPIGRHAEMPTVLYLQEPSRSLYEAQPELPWSALPSPGRPSLPYAARFFHNLIKIQGKRVILREERANAASFTTILVNSHFSRESVLRAYGLDAQVCYLGVDTNIFRWQQLPRERFVVGLGAFTPSKGVEFIIRALGTIPGDRPPLVWIGNAEQPGYISEMERLASLLGVTFTPHLRLEESELILLLNQAGAMAYAPRLEPFGFAPLEANACGLPVVAVAEGGVRETVIDGVNGLLVEHDPAAMGASLSRLLDNPTYSSQLGKSARKWVEQEWSLASAVDRIEKKLYATLAASSMDREI